MDESVQEKIEIRGFWREVRTTEKSELECSDLWLWKNARDVPLKQPDGKTKLASLKCF